MKPYQHLGRGRQAGFSLIKIALIIAIVGFFGQIALRSLPFWSQYSKIKVAVTALESSGETNPEELRRKFSARADIDNITAISSKDLDISIEATGPQIHYSFTGKVPVFGNASLVYEFAK